MEVFIMPKKDECLMLGGMCECLGQHDCIRLSENRQNILESLENGDHNGNHEKKIVRNKCNSQSKELC